MHFNDFLRFSWHHCPLFPVIRQELGPKGWELDAPLLRGALCLRPTCSTPTPRDAQHSFCGYYQRMFSLKDLTCVAMSLQEDEEQPQEDDSVKQEAAAPDSPNWSRVRRSPPSHSAFAFCVHTAAHVNFLLASQSFHSAMSVSFWSSTFSIPDEN